MANPPLILLSGYYGHGNAGDELILRLLHGALAELPAEIRYFAGPRPSWPGAVPRGHPGAVARALWSARALVLGGGELFQTRTSARSLAAYLFGPAVCWLRQKPFWVFGVGLDPDLPALALRASAAVLRRARKVWVRDAASQAALARFGVASERMEDAVWAWPTTGALPGAPGGRRLLWIPRFPDGEDTVRRLIPLMDGLPEFEHALLALHPAHDGVYVEKLRSRLRAPTPLWKSDGPEGLPAVVAGADVVLSMRYHGLVLAALARRPAVALAAHGKVAELATSLGSPVLTVSEGSVPALRAALRLTLAGPLPDASPRRASARRALGALRGELSSVLNEKL